MSKHVAKPTAGTKLAEAVAQASGKRIASGAGRRSAEVAK